MLITKKVRLSRSNLMTFGVLIVCECGEKHWIPHNRAAPLDSYSCDWCWRPLVLISREGHMHYVGDKALNRRVEDDGGQE